MSKYADYDIKRENELLQLNLFKECFTEISNVSVLILGDDPPDGLIQIGEQTIAIELTHIIWDTDKDGFNKKAQESTAAIIMDLAEKKYSQYDFPPVQVNVSFVDNYGVLKYKDCPRLNSSDKERLSKYIVQKVIDSIPLPENELFKVAEYDADWERILDPKIQSIYIERFSEMTENCWSADSGGIVPHITIDKLNNIISAKDKDLNRYKEKFDKSWLVIIEDWAGMSGYFSFRNSEEVINNKFITEFDRVFILRSKNREVIELKLLNNVQLSPLQ